MQNVPHSESLSTGGWRVRRSIALELEVAIDFARQGPATLPSSLLDLVTAIPPIWIDEIDTLGTSTRSDGARRYTLDYLARWAGAEEIEDYDVASGEMRKVTLDAAVSSVVEASGLKPRPNMEPTEQLIDLELRLYSELALRTGLYPPSDDRVLEQERGEVTAAIRVLRGEPLHGRFWQWVDRFYHEAYLPWRTTRLGAIAELEQIAINGLGGSEGVGPPDLNWLPRDNALIAIPSIGKACEAGAFEVMFWAEPFGLASALLPAPGILTLSFSALGTDRDYSANVSDNLTSKAKALSDPTRTSILRMIRNLDADNTQIAGYLEVSRPAVSAHAKILADAGFISTTHVGRQARHTFHPDVVRRFCDDLLQYLDVPAEDPRR